MNARHFTLALISVVVCTGFTHATTLLWDESIDGDLAQVIDPLTGTRTWDDRLFVASGADTYVFRGDVFFVPSTGPGVTNKVDVDFIYLDNNDLGVIGIELVVQNAIEELNITIYSRAPDPTGSSGPVYGVLAANLAL